MQAADFNWETFLRGAVAVLPMFHLDNRALLSAKGAGVGQESRSCGRVEGLDWRQLHQRLRLGGCAE